MRDPYPQLTQFVLFSENSSRFNKPQHANSATKIIEVQNAKKLAYANRVETKRARKPNLMERRRPQATSEEPSKSSPKATKILVSSG